MADLGCLNSTLTLQCKHCDHRPDEKSVVEAFALHCQVEHDTDDYRFDLVAVCTCGAAMTHAESRPTGGGFKDYVTCPACGNTGYIKREVSE